MNEALYEAALAAIKRMYGDTSVSKATARANLNTLRDEIDVLIEALGDDDETEETE